MWPISAQVCIETRTTRDLDERVPEGYRTQMIPLGVTSEQAEAHCAVRGRRLCTGDELTRWVHCAVAGDDLARINLPDLATLPCLGPLPPIRDLFRQVPGDYYGSLLCETAAEYVESTAVRAEEGAASHLLIQFLLHRTFISLSVAREGCGPYVRCCLDR